MKRLAEEMERQQNKSIFEARKGTVLTIDRAGDSLTIDPDQHYGGTTHLSLNEIGEVRQIGLAGATDTVIITAGPASRPRGILFDGPDTAASFAVALSQAVRDVARPDSY